MPVNGTVSVPELGASVLVCSLLCRTRAETVPWLDGAGRGKPRTGVGARGVLRDLGVPSLPPRPE